MGEMGFHIFYMQLTVAVDLARQQAVSSRQEHLWTCVFQVCCDSVCV